MAHSPSSHLAYNARRVIEGVEIRRIESDYPSSIPKLKDVTFRISEDAMAIFITVDAAFALLMAAEAAPI